MDALLRSKALICYIAFVLYWSVPMAKEKEKAKKKGRRAYLQDIRPNLSGEYVYTGAHLNFVPEKMSFRRAAFAIAGYALLSLAGFVAAGFVSAGGMGNCFYVIIPYIAEAIAVFTLLLAVYKAISRGSRLRDYEYESSVVKMPVRALLSAIFAAIGLVCIAVFTAINGIDGSAGEFALLLVAKAVAITVPFLMRKLLASLRWEKE